MPTILGAGDSSSGYDIENSLREYGTDNYENFTPSSAGNRRTWTWSCWIKPDVRGQAFNLFGAGDNVNTRAHIDFNTNGDFQVEAKNGGTTKLKHEGTTRLRDPAAFVHIVWRLDTTDGTAANRSRVYVNGEQVVFSSLGTTPSQNDELEINNNSLHTIAKRGWADENYFPGYIAEAAFTDGTSYAPTQFAETNSDGVWVPKDFKDDTTFGSNGFYLEFKQTGTSANSSGIGADTSGNDNHWTPNNHNATHITTDTPTNTFCTLNPLLFFDNTDPFATATLSEGNMAYSSTTTIGADSNIMGTHGANKGKWFYEFKMGTTGNVGMAGGWTSYRNHDRIAYYSGNGYKYTESGSSSYGATYAGNDIIGVAMDLDNQAVTFYKNGASQGEITSAIDDNGLHYLPFMWDGSGSLYRQWEFNSGNPPYANSSDNADANGYGKFEYAVPSGYYAICTKNLAKFG